MVCSESITLAYILYMIASLLSFIGSLIVISVILKKRLFTTYSFKILLIISINDLIRAGFGICLSFVKSLDTLCAFIAFVFGIVSISNYIWALCLTFTIYQIVVKEEIDFTKHHKKWLVASVVIPGILTGLPFLTQSYGLRNGYCELKGDRIGLMWRFLAFHAEVFVILVLNLILSIKIFKKIREIGRFSLSFIIFGRGLIYPIIIAVVDLPILVLRIIQIVDSSCILLYFLICFLFLFLLQGFANSVVFLFNKTVKEAVFEVNDDRDIERKNDRAESSLYRGSLHISFRSTIN